MKFIEIRNGWGSIEMVRLPESIDRTSELSWKDMNFFRWLGK